MYYNSYVMSYISNYCSKEQDVSTLVINRCTIWIVSDIFNLYSEDATCNCYIIHGYINYDQCRTELGS